MISDTLKIRLMEAVIAALLVCMIGGPLVYLGSAIYSEWKASHTWRPPVTECPCSAPVKD